MIFGKSQAHARVPGYSAARVPALETKQKFAGHSSDQCRFRCPVPETAIRHLPFAPTYILAQPAVKFNPGANQILKHLRQLTTPLHRRQPVLVSITPFGSPLNIATL